MEHQRSFHQNVWISRGGMQQKHFSPLLTDSLRIHSWNAQFNSFRIPRLFTFPCLSLYSSPRILIVSRSVEEGWKEKGKGGREKRERGRGRRKAEKSWKKGREEGCNCVVRAIESRRSIQTNCIEPVATFLAISTELKSFYMHRASLNSLVNPSARMKPPPRLNSSLTLHPRIKATR